MEDSAIIELLYNHSEDGLARLSEKYNKLLQTVVSSVLYDCGDAEECVNDTLKGNVFEKQELVSYLKKT